MFVPMCRQNEGRPCTETELSGSYLDDRVIALQGCSLSRSQDIFNQSGPFNYPRETTLAYNPSLFVYQGELRAFLRVDFDFAKDVKMCPPHKMTNNSRCPDDGSAMAMCSALVMGKLDSQLQFKDDIASWVVLNEDLKTAASFSNTFYFPQDGRAFMWGDEVWVTYNNYVGNNRHRMFVQRVLPSETAPVHLHRGGGIPTSIVLISIQIG